MSPEPPPAHPSGEPRPSRALLAAVLVLVTLGLYARVGSFEFHNYDDPSYVSRNPIVLGGLTSEGVAYAFRGGHSTNWHPLTTLSHLLDVELFGEDAGKHHLVSAGLHALNAALCFLALCALSRRTWPSFVVAALFALHPLRVESVAWISERKDVLSGTFFFLTLLSWARYVRAPGAGRYALVALALALGLMAKQMLLTVPFLLVLLDVWPLGRWRGAAGAEGRSLGQLLVEKLPLFALALVAAVLMWSAQSTGGTIGGLAALPLGDRIGNAFGAYFAYLRLTAVPTGLAVFYPHPAIAQPGDALALWGPGALGAVLVAAVSLLAWKRRRSQPELAVGWFWYVGMLVPVIGLVQIGSQAYADRYTYLATLGPVWVLVTLAADRIERRPSLRTPLVSAAALLIGLYALAAWRQTGVWRDSRSLNEHALSVTERNYIAHANLGLVYLNEDLDPILAEVEFRRAIELNPIYREGVYNLALAYLGQARTQQAEDTLRRLLVMVPGHAPALARLAEIQIARGDTAGALEDLKRSTEADPTDAGAWLALGGLYLDAGEPVYAEECAERVLELRPNEIAAHLLHGRAAQALEYPGAALQRFQTAVATDPESYEARVALARQYADMGQLVPAKTEVLAAVELASVSVEADVILAKILVFEGQEEAARERLDLALANSPEHPEANDLLGSMLWNAGDVAGAEAAYERALEGAPDYDMALYNLGALVQAEDREAEALALFRQLLENLESPFAPDAASSLAWIRATSPDPELRDGADAIKWAEFALRVRDDGGPGILNSLAAAFAEGGRFDDAIRAQEAALTRAPDAMKPALERRLERFRAGKPYHRKR